MAVVVNKYKSEFDVYNGRGSKWGNPFPITPFQNREQVVEMYRNHLWRQIQKGEVTKSDLLALEGKRLGCFCKPQACHGDVIVAAIKWAKNS